MEQWLNHWGRGWKGLLLFSAWAAIVLLAGSDSFKMKDRLSFTNEQVRITLDRPRNKAFVESAMLYRNSTDRLRKINLFYPVYYSEFQSLPINLTIEKSALPAAEAEKAFPPAIEAAKRENTTENLSFSPLKSEVKSPGIFAEIQVEPEQALVVRIRYNQDLKIEKNSYRSFFCYNLTNSAGWGRPVNQGVFIIKADNSIRINKIYAGIRNNDWYRRELGNISGIKIIPSAESEEDPLNMKLFEGENFVDSGLTISFNEEVKR